MKVGKNEAKLDIYAILGVSVGASNDEVRRAYRRLVATYHPDRFRGDDPRVAEQRMKEINVAAAILLDPDARSHYTRLRAAQRTQQARAAAPTVRRDSVWPFTSPERAPRGGFPKAPPPPIWEAPLASAKSFFARRPWAPIVVAVSLTMLVSCASQWVDGPVPVASARYELPVTPHFKTIFEE